MKFAAAAVWTLATAGIALAAGSTTVTVAPSSLGYRQMSAACPGALAAMSFTLHHLRIAEAAGATTDIDSKNPNAQSIVVALGAQRAKVWANAAQHTVTAKHVVLASNKKVACVTHD